MSKMVKELIVQDLEKRYSGVDNALMVEFVGCDGLVSNEFRRDLRSRHMRIEIVKNSLFRKAVAKGPLSKLDAALHGPNAVVTGGESLIDVAKVIEEWMPKIAGLKLRAAVLEGELLDESRVQQLAKMPTKRDLQAQIAGMALSPGARLASAIDSGGGNIAACIKTIVEKLEKGETVARLSA